MDNEAAVRSVVEAWACAIRDADMAGVLAHHSDDVVLFDVPPQLQAKGVEAYRAAWEAFFAHQGAGGAFNLGELTIYAGDDVAFCHSIVTVGAADPASQFPVRLTVGLRKVDSKWRIVHEHHSGTGE
jgi:uncharacterized protein (TIGR02246 family)